MLLCLMYQYSKHDNVCHLAERVTRFNQTFVFKTETRIGVKYQNSPFYKGTLSWNALSKDTQFVDNILLFKTEITKSYRTFKQ